jgi:hypothetical protein
MSRAWNDSQAQCWVEFEAQVRAWQAMWKHQRVQSFHEALDIGHRLCPFICRRRGRRVWTWVCCHGLREELSHYFGLDNRMVVVELFDVGEAVIGLYSGQNASHRRLHSARAIGRCSRWTAVSHPLSNPKRANKGGVSSTH